MEPARFTTRSAIFAELVEVADLSASVGQSALEDAGVDPRGFLVLAYVGTLEPASSTVVARERGIGRTTMRDALQRLEDRGDIERAPSPSDRRAQLVRLTPQGRERLDRGLRALHEAGERVEAKLDRPLDEYLARLGELQDCFRALGAPADIRRP